MDGSLPKRSSPSRRLPDGFETASKQACMIVGGGQTWCVVVAGELPRQAHNAPLHLFSASPELVGFGQGAYRRRSENTSRVLEQLFEGFQGEGLAMSYTMADFTRDYFREHFLRLTPEDRREALQSLPLRDRREVLQSLPLEELLAGLPPEERLAGLLPKERLAGLSEEQIRQYLDQLTEQRPATPRKPRRKK
jgi:hypothetical protein